MSKKKKILIVFIAILFPLYFIIFKNNNEDIKISNNFIVEDFSDVSSVVIKKDDRIISLKKNSDNWYINNTI